MYLVTLHPETLAALPGIKLSYLDVSSRVNEAPVKHVAAGG